MMALGCFSREEEDLFFDPRDDLSSVFDSCPASPAISDVSFPEESSSKRVNSDPFYQVWMKSPCSVQERRAKFKQIMGLDPIPSPYSDYISPNREHTVDDKITEGIDRISSDCGAVLLSSALENESLRSCCPVKAPSTSQERSSDELFDHRIKNLSDSKQNGASRSLREDERVFMSSYAKQFMRRNNSSSSTSSEKMTIRKKFGWLRRLGAVTCIVDRQRYNFASDVSDSEESSRTKFQKIQVRPYRKQSKEFSAVYTGQNFKAHRGAILCMKFSPDGEYLASAGEDGVVRVWQVMECARTSEYEIPNDDPACIYLTVSRNTEVAALHADKEKMIRSRSLRSTSDSACVVVPPEVFHISEKPLYEFHGHKGDVLDLAWSNDKHLLSSSVDKTVRLWQLGCDGCLKVFAHNNYVTCVQFKPNDERYFISGSIDGKVRIWEIPNCRVVNWTDIKEIVTAVCYHPDGKGVIVGSMMGDCSFYDASDNRLQLDRKVSFGGKKKSVEKRITGFQFCPSSSCKLMVTSAESKIRILDGFDVVSKYKGFQNSGSQISASFTYDGKHIVSASEDSKVYIWNHSNTDHVPSSNLKSSRSSECFDSSHVCIAVPWQGFSSKKPTSDTFELTSSHESNKRYPSLVDSLGNKILYLSPSSNVILSPEFFADVLRRGSATWPEEKFPSSLSKMSSSGKSHFKFLKSSCPKNISHAWGQVIVTAGWDGRIRSFQNYGLPVYL
ncbi:WD repeat-containing protein YMR102C [Dendrobium catenatum]|uniref:WD repeat-containing protein YMR102C n=1 Tax=Dendrobium catenatum TaxID=906689 RepID=UPI0009F54179|nr:WD repeat-containing protein YMR102C [Dendrobium catenatum]